MKKTVIAIWGHSAQGKSSSIKEIVNAISFHYPRSVIDTRISGNDIQVIIQLDKVKIGVESQGDPGGRLQRSLDLFLQENCDIIICATRTRGDTVTSVEGLFPAYEVVWASNYFSREKNIDQSNRIFSNHIILLLEEIIAGRY
ncbi:MAG: hypothetical protein V4539_09875 [Bacteroidota bacterium]